MGRFPVEPPFYLTARAGLLPSVPGRVNSGRTAAHDKNTRIVVHTCRQIMPLPEGSEKRNYRQCNGTPMK
jgi:hypothetical protein